MLYWPVPLAASKALSTAVTWVSTARPGPVSRSPTASSPLKAITVRVVPVIVPVSWLKGLLVRWLMGVLLKMLLYRLFWLPVPVAITPVPSMFSIAASLLTPRAPATLKARPVSEALVTAAGESAMLPMLPAPFPAARDRY